MTTPESGYTLEGFDRGQAHPNRSIVVRFNAHDWANNSALTVYPSTRILLEDVYIPRGCLSPNDVMFVPDQEEFALFQSLLGHKNAPTP